MELPEIYTPLTELEGFTNWDLSEEGDIFYFCYKRKVKGICLRICAFIFRHESYGDLYPLTDPPVRDKGQFQSLLEPYKEEIMNVIAERDRIRKTLKPKKYKTCPSYREEPLN